MFGILKLISACTLLIPNIFSGKIGTDRTSSIYYGKPVGQVMQYPNGTTELVNTGEYSYMGSLELNGVHLCGAVIIRSDSVLTAAHCTKNYQPKDLRVRAGTYIREEKEFPGSNIQTRNVLTYTNHESYNTTGMQEFDIAIISLEKPFNLSPYVNIIEMADASFYRSLIGEKVEILGWGSTKSDLKAKHLLKALVLISPISSCEAIAQADKNITNSMICLQPANLGEGLCHGDSGGPLTFKETKAGSTKHILLGLASSGLILKSSKHCLTDRGSIYADVSYLREWINDSLQKIGESSSTADMQ